MIMVHGDDQGLILPPRLAPHQVVMVPIYKNDTEKSAVLPVAERIKQELVEADIRVKVDQREHLSPGFKFNDWEMRGVPVRIEIGPKDVTNNAVALARRDKPGREGKQFVSQEGLAQTVQGLLGTVQDRLLDRARRFRDEHTYTVDNYDDFKEAIKTGFASVWWAGSDADEQQVQAETKATLRCLPLDQPGGSGVCFYTGKPADRIAIFGRAY
jgi:prolyl-tRNA synthetase